MIMIGGGKQRKVKEKYLRRNQQKQKLRGRETHTALRDYSLADVATV